MRAADLQAAELRSASACLRFCQCLLLLMESAQYVEEYQLFAEALPLMLACLLLRHVARARGDHLAFDQSSRYLGT